MVFLIHSIYRIFVLFFVILKRLIIEIYKKITFIKHKFEPLYARPLKNGKYKVIYRCVKCR